MDASHEKIDAAHNTVSRLIELDLRSLLAEEGLREFIANLDYLKLWTSSLPTSTVQWKSCCWAFLLMLIHSAFNFRLWIPPLAS
jgi:hypothetical protein